MCFVVIKQTLAVCSIKPVRFLFGLLVLSLSAGISGCANTPEGVHNHYFYPPLPAKPRIQFLTSFSGTELKKSKKNSFSDFVLGKKASDDLGGITKPYGVWLYEGKIYVVDLRLPGYVVLSLDDQIIKKVTGSGEGRMVKPVNITFDADGTKYITDTQRERILVYDKDDKFVRLIGEDKQFKPGDVVITSEFLYVTDLKNHKIHVLDKDSGATVFTFGKAGSKDKEFFFPTNMALTADGFLYIADTGNYRVLKYVRGGKQLIKQYGRIGNSLGQFARPKGIAVDKNGRLYVVDSAFENVQIFDEQGNVLLFFGAPGNEIGNLNLPVDVEIDYDNVESFRKYERQGFKIEYLILVSSQFGPNKVNVYGFGEITGTKSPSAEETDTGDASALEDK